VTGRHNVAVLTDQSPWTRLGVVAVYAVAMAVVEASVVYYLRKLFALQYNRKLHFRSLPLSTRLPAARAGPRARHDRHASRGRLPGGPRLVAEAFLLPVRLRRLGYRLLRCLKIMLHWPASLATRDLLFLTAAPVVGAGLAADHRLVWVHRCGGAAPGEDPAAMMGEAPRRSPPGGEAERGLVSQKRRVRVHWYRACE